MFPRILSLLAALLLLAGCGANQEAATGATALPATSLPATAPATTDSALDLPLLAAPTSAPTATAASADASPTPAPLPAAHSVQRIVIAAIELDQPAVSVGLDDQRVPIVPKHDIGWYNLSAAPGQGSNIVLWGHVLRFLDSPEISAPFRRLKELTPGAQIVLYDDANVAHTYTVTEQVWVTPDQVQYILPTGSEQLTLVSCIGDKVKSDAGVEMTHRLVTIAKPTNNAS